mmetsp:Transcript_20164/g.36517  ORF Transcript_20164/g.36517 Transcript_20164/m.36517 type:complete len:264 (+) Transcript_20164:85-876(+)
MADLEDVSMPPRLSRDTAIGTGLAMCCCFPIRLGVLVCALATWVGVVVATIDRMRGNAFNEGLRHYIGGYTRYGHLANGVVDGFGTIFALAGVMGTYFLQRSMIRAYFWWQVARAIVWFAVGINSLLLLRKCEMWVNNVDAMEERYEWNEPAFEIALAGECPRERTTFYVLCTLTLVAFMYVTYMTQRFLEMMDLYPKYLLRLHKDLSSGIFVAHSVAERMPINQAPKPPPHYTLAQPANSPFPMYNQPPVPGAPAPVFGRRW